MWVQCRRSGVYGLRGRSKTTVMTYRGTVVLSCCDGVRRLSTWQRRQGPRPRRSLCRRPRTLATLFSPLSFGNNARVFRVSFCMRSFHTVLRPWQSVRTLRETISRTDFWWLHAAYAVRGLNNIASQSLARLLCCDLFAVRIAYEIVAAFRFSRKNLKYTLELRFRSCEMFASTYWI